MGVSPSAHRLAVAALALALLLGTASSAAARRSGRQLLQQAGASPAPASGDAGGGPQTQLLAAINTNGQAVTCINVTKPAGGTQHGASGGGTPDQAQVQPLIDVLCANKTSGQFYNAFKQGGAAADVAAEALKTAPCPDLAEYVAGGVLAVAQYMAQSESEVEGFANNFVTAMRRVGVPACVTLLVGDGSGNVVAEKYFAS